ncbi:MULTISPECIES: DUF222 domain-containing protein [unclassified Microbispora]|uniref:DUF222 domain-containing protein n=1 Tax=unclassified Microbispora TaxID=2614687 RepID=UPI001438F442|nr:DUF222 domain-containing protein [Microbispora sp. SCL1-1]NJP23218.1 DUF222 domain-containing protein [Microbispora sp. CL1-1]
MAQELALTPLPDDVDVCLAEAEELLFARDRITSALADRVGRVHRAGQARQHGHASTRCWLRTSGGMTVGGAGRLLTLGAELPRLPTVREKFATGELAAGVVEAICAAVAGLTDEQATLAEPILVDLASKAGAAEVAKAGRHLRAVLDPDGEERDERADYGRRFLRVRPGKGGGVEGEFYLPREAGARLMTLLQAYAKLRAQGDDRPLTVRQADALIALLEQKIVTELLVVVSAESLPTDPDNTNPETTDPTADPATQDTDPATQDPADPATADEVSDHFADLGDSAPSDYVPDPAGSTDEPGQADDTADHVENARDAGGFGEGRDDTGDPTPAEADEFDAAEAGAGTGRDAGERRPGECEPSDTASTAVAEGDHTASTASAEGGETVSTSSAERHETAPATGGDGDRAAAPSGAPHTTRRGAAWPADRGGHSDTAPSDTASWDTASSEAAWPDPPPEDASAHHTHAGPRPARDCRHGQGTPGTSEGASPGAGQGASRGASAGTMPGASLGTALGASASTLLGASLGGALGMVPPGLLLATGQVLPLSSVHRLARTSALVRIVMNAEGQVLDMGRKVRLATPAQRRAIYARYDTCWIDGCPLPATMCQIDHADNWSTGGLTDLKLLGPACQFHNRDRYQHPDRYTRRKEGEDRWAFTYHRLGRTRRPHE